ncbi:MAG: hypothetical protein QM504_03205 [Pseudomonadota bacterium]
MNDFKLVMSVNRVTTNLLANISDGLVNINTKTKQSCPTCNCGDVLTNTQTSGKPTSEPLFIPLLSLGKALVGTLFARDFTLKGGFFLDDWEGCDEVYSLNVGFVEQINLKRNKSVGLDGVELLLSHDTETNLWTCSIDSFSRTHESIELACGEVFNDFVSTEIAFFEE